MLMLQMQSFVSGLKSRNQDTRFNTAQELFVFVKSDLREATNEEINAFLDDFNHHIFEMVSSSDVHEKKGGILAISKLFQLNTDFCNHAVVLTCSLFNKCRRW